MFELVDIVARAICRSRTCEGSNCCQWPANDGRLDCPASKGGYTDAARAAIEAIDIFRDEEKRKACKHNRRLGGGGVGPRPEDSYSYWHCQDCGASFDSRTPCFSQKLGAS